MHGGCAGRNAVRREGIEPRQTVVLWWPSQYEEAKAIPALGHERGTNGVGDHGLLNFVPMQNSNRRAGCGKFARPVPKGALADNGQRLLNE